jgi:hypothetical protein
MGVRAAGAGTERSGRGEAGRGRGISAGSTRRATKEGYSLYHPTVYRLTFTAVQYDIGRSTDRSSPTPLVSRESFHIPVTVCTDHPCRLRNDFLAAIIAAVGVGSKKTGRTFCGYA